MYDGRDAVGVSRYLVLDEGVVETVLEALCHRVRSGIDALVSYGFERGDACGGGNGLGVVCAALRNSAEAVPFGVVAECHKLHDVGSAADCRAGLAARDYLRHGGEVRLQAPAHLRAAGREAESGNDFVHDEEDAVLSCEVLEVMKELRVLQRECAVVCAVALDDNGGYVVIFREDGVNGCNVNRRHNYGIQDLSRNAAKSLP